MPARLVVREPGPHGVGLAKKYPELKDWPDKLEAWLKDRGFADSSGVPNRR